MLEEARSAITLAMQPAMRRPLVLSVLAMAVLVVGASFALGLILDVLVDVSGPWLLPMVSAVNGYVWLLLPIYLVVPAAILVISRFTNVVAGPIEIAEFPMQPMGRNLGRAMVEARSQSVAMGALAANGFALCFALIPGVNVLLFAGLNTYLLGKHAFETAASRHMTLEQAQDLASRHTAAVMTRGAVLMLIAAVPLLNLLVPIVAIVIMTRLCGDLLTA